MRWLRELDGPIDGSTSRCCVRPARAGATGWPPRCSRSWTGTACCGPRLTPRVDTRGAAARATRPTCSTRMGADADAGACRSGSPRPGWHRPRAGCCARCGSTRAGPAGCCSSPTTWWSTACPGGSCPTTWRRCCAGRATRPPAGTSFRALGHRLLAARPARAARSRSGGTARRRRSVHSGPAARPGATPRPPRAVLRVAAAGCHRAAAEHGAGGLPRLGQRRAARRARASPSPGGAAPATRCSSTLEGHGREEHVVPGADLSRTVGWFTSMYPVRLRPGAGDLDAAVQAGQGAAAGGAGRRDRLRRCVRDRRARRRAGAAVQLPRPARRPRGLGGWRRPGDATGPAAGDQRPRAGRLVRGRADLAGRRDRGRRGDAVRRPLARRADRTVAVRTVAGTRRRTSRSWRWTSDRSTSSAPDVADVLPASPLQEGFYFHAQVDGQADDVYVVQQTLELHGAVDAAGAAPGRAGRARPARPAARVVPAATRRPARPG